MHGPTCIFWANLTPFSLKGLELKVSLGLTNALNCVVSPTVDLLHVPMQTEVECASRVIENAASMARELHLTSNLGRHTTPTRARLAGQVHAVDVDELATCRTSWRLRIRQAATLLGLLRVLYVLQVYRIPGTLPALRVRCV